jgi:hypothetical protein
MRARWYGVGSVGSVGVALQDACRRRCRWDEDWRNRCSRADRHSLSRRRTHRLVALVAVAKAGEVGAVYGQVERLQWTWKLEKRAEHDEARGRDDRL